MGKSAGGTWFVRCTEVVRFLECQLLEVPLYYISGAISISGKVSLTVNSELNGESPQFTLTCVSTGGPATMVTWTRDSATATEGTETVLNDPVTAHYTHSLTVTGRLGGLHTCTVANNKPSTASANIRVQSRLKKYSTSYIFFLRIYSSLNSWQCNSSPERSH